MSDVFREAGHSCPSCRAPLRVFNHRWICDACFGMLLSVEDFEQTLVDVGALTVRVEDDTPTERRCPRCEGRLRACLVHVDRKVLEPDILHCEAHGLWLGGGMLEDILTKVARKAHRGSSSNRVGGGAGGGGAIRKWWETTRPIVHTPFASTLVGRQLPCPLCKRSLELRGRLWACDEHGVFVENAAIAEMMTEMTHGPWQPPEGTSVGQRTCPACPTAMMMSELEGVTVDGCRTHGIWFDPGELEITLEHAADHPGWFRRLFG